MSKPKIRPYQDEDDTLPDDSWYVVVHIDPFVRGHAQDSGIWPDDIYDSKELAHDMAIKAKEVLKEFYLPKEHDRHIGILKVYKLEPTEITV